MGLCCSKADVPPPYIDSELSRLIEPSFVLGEMGVRALLHQLSMCENPANTGIRKTMVSRTHNAPFSSDHFTQKGLEVLNDSKGRLVFLLYRLEPFSNQPTEYGADAKCLVLFIKKLLAIVCPNMPVGGTVYASFNLQGYSYADLPHHQS